MKNIEIQTHGLICDNPKCDWKDESISFDKFIDYVNAPCPQCGENVLTDNDYQNVVTLFEQIDRVNQFSSEEFKDMTKVGDNDPQVKITLNTHGKISIKSIELLS